MRAPAVLRTVAALAGASLVGCEFDGITTPTVAPRAVVHAVLNPDATEQVILVQQTLASRDAPLPVTISATDPIASLGGVPVSGARVVIFGPGNDSVVAVEDNARQNDQTGRGVYRLTSRTDLTLAGTRSTNVLRLVPGSSYRLVVETPFGVTRGTTTIPTTTAARGQRRSLFNLDRDTLRVERSSGARGYLLRHSIPGVSQRDLLTGSLAPALLAPSELNDASWAFAFRRREIRPGMVQRFAVIALDSNYYRYIESNADPFRDETKGNALTGGVGLFGSVVTLLDADLDLVTDRDHPIEGEWMATGTTRLLPSALRLYESPRFPVSGTTIAGTSLVGTAIFPDSSLWLAEAVIVEGSLSLVLRSRDSAYEQRHSGTFDGVSIRLTTTDGKEELSYRQ